MMFLLVTLLGLAASIDANNIGNLALHGRATQSSQYDNSYAHASNAIDGNRNSNYFDGSCTHTKAQAYSWWRVDLLKQYKINTVIIVNRGDCCPERLNGAEIRIGDSLYSNGNNNPRCAVIYSIPAGSTGTFNCYGMRGRYVNVVLPRYDYLTLCELEVYGSE
ncbi:hypothetical protein UPYG_G00315770 [Umbra pygmaea]|uniref:Fucolectin tachylectin-4 pentraxin-1 domain-containing protein n=1 Tax=Umbra pygmaea TaxID=75934 RepID=A0ABD0WI83_UMBPY